MLKDLLENNIKNVSIQYGLNKKLAMICIDIIAEQQKVDKLLADVVLANNNLHYGY